MKLLVSMGIPDPALPGDGPRRPRALRGRLREVDVEARRIVRELAVEVRHGPRPDAHQELTAASWDGDLVLQAAHTEVLWLDPRRGSVVDRITNPLFHGVHSAAPLADGGLIVTCAGIESVVIVDRRGRTRAHHFLRAGTAFADAYPGVVDFRKVDHEALKPHTHHPNHAAEVGADRWVTCFETREAVTLGGGRRIPLPEGFPHDGRLRGGLLWFTQVHGRVVAVDPITLARRVELDLVGLTGGRARLGWCRGVEVVGSRLFVGFTQLRSTRHREVLRWLLQGEAGTKLPTRVVEVDLDGPRIVGETLVGDDGQGTIYGLLAR